jgi:hypothetical protein
MRQIVQVCVVVSAVACSRSESTSDRSKPPDQPAQVAQPKIPDSKRGSSVESYEVRQPVAGLTIGLEATGLAAWKLTARNDTDDPMQLVWDESSFVTGAGKSWGRLIAGTTRRGDVEKAHPPAPIAPHATMSETAIPESTTAIGEFDYDMRQDLAGGRLYVTVATPGAKRSWMATVAESDVKPRGWWCWAALKGDLKSCERSQDLCESRRKISSERMSAPNTACQEQASVHCFIGRISGDQISMCYPDKASCESSQTSSSTGCEERR